MKAGSATKDRAEERPKARRTTISLPPKVHAWGEELRQADGFTSLSDLFEYMIRIRKGQTRG